MKIIIAEDYEKMSEEAAEIIIKKTVDNPESILGLATGSTPEGMYRYLVKEYEAGRVDFSQVTTVNLDEYVGLEDSHPQSFRYFMDEKFFSHVNIKKEKIHMPGGSQEQYEELLQDLGGADVQILGIGGNGHIGFNEPADIFVKYVNVVELTEDTIKANSRFFDSVEEVPRKAVTMGIKDIMSAKTVVLMASGSGKKDIMKKALFEEITPMVPASILQLHPDLVVITDREAGAELKEVS